MKKISLLNFLLTPLFLLIPVILWAAPTPDMFAYGMKIDVSPGSAFYNLALPMEVYQAVTRQDLGDIRVFNSDETVAPHVIYRPDTPTYQKAVLQADLPFFPVFLPENRPRGEIRIHIERDAQGAIAAVSAGDGGPQPLAEQKIAFYLIDAAALKDKSVSTLVLEWSDPQGDFMTRLYVEESADLYHWHKIGSAAIARLHYGNYFLERKKIPLPGTCKAFLRLSGSGNLADIALKKVNAFADKTLAAKDFPEDQWIQPDVRPLPEKPGQYTLDPGGFFPVDKIRIRLNHRNSMAIVKLFSECKEDEGRPMTRWQGLVYNLDYKQEAFYNPIIRIRETYALCWRLAMDQNEAMPLDSPVVAFGWQPHRLAFLARGKGPFVLAYGSADVSRPDFKVAPLLGEYRQGSEKISPGRGILGPQYPLGGPERLEPPPPPLPWKKYILWACLFTGVFAIAGMTVALYRQIASGEKRKN